MESWCLSSSDQVCDGCHGVIDEDFAFWWCGWPPDGDVGLVGCHGQRRARVWSSGLVLISLRHVT